MSLKVKDESQDKKKKSLLDRAQEFAKSKGSAFLSAMIFAVIVLWLIVGALFSGDDETTTKIVEKKTFTVQVVDSQSQMKNLFVQVRGETEPSRSVTLKSQTNGTIEAVSDLRGGAIDEGFLIAKVALENRTEKLAEAKAVLRQRQLEHKTSRALSKKGFRAETGVSKTQSELKKAESLVAAIELDLSYTKILMPFKGVLERRHVEIGDSVSMGTDIATVVDLDPIRLTGPVAEKEIGSIQKGADAIVKLVTGQELRGKVTYKSTVADDHTHTFRIELDIPNPGNIVPAGITADIYIPVKKVEAHFVSPAIVSLADDGTLGLKTVKEGKIEFSPVTLVDTQPDGVWVTGLPPKARIVTSGQEFVVEGQEVNVSVYKEAKNGDTE